MQSRKVSPDFLPSPFVNADGSIITTAEEWEMRRGHIKNMLEHYIYGPRPSYRLNRVEKGDEYPDTRVSENALTFFARLYYDQTRYFSIRVTRPAGLCSLPVIIRYESQDTIRFPIEAECISSGKYIIIAINNLTAAPDNRRIEEPYMYEAKAIMAWACAASLTVDYIETQSFADCRNIAIAGMSRTGKAALCAGTYDERFTVVIANSSGAAGASGLRRFGDVGSQAIDIAVHEPNWVSDNLRDYRDDAASLPLDMHYARALIAPRVILATEASDGADALWAGPISAYKIWEASDYAFKLCNAQDNNLIHLRPGEHLQLPEDYERMMRVVESVFYGQTLDTAPFRENRFPD